MVKKPADKRGSSEFLSALRQGLLIGAAVLALLVPLRMVQQHWAQGDAPGVPVATAPAPAAAPAAPSPTPASPAAPIAEAPAKPPVPGVRLADFGPAQPSADVKFVANWAVHTRDHGAKSIVIIDKKLARVFVLDPAGKLKADAPALLGEWVGDYTTPGVGDKPLSLLKPEEKTTPAGRFVAEVGLNTSGEDVVWIDYENAVSMHRVRKVKESERRFARLASQTHTDNRISNGCVNLPKSFYETVLAPTVRGTGAVIYVLPDTKPLGKVFTRAWDVTSPLELAQRAGASAAKPG